MPLPQDLLNGTSCYTCLGVSIGDALDLALWQSISESIAGGGETFYLLWDSGNNILSPQVGDRFTYQ